METKKAVTIVALLVVAGLVGGIAAGYLSGGGSGGGGGGAAADDMTDAQKMAEVQNCINTWMAKVKADVAKNSKGYFPADVSVEADPGGCDLDLRELSPLFKAGLADAGVCDMNPAPGVAKVKILYKLPSNGNPAKAKTRITIGLGAAGAAIHSSKYKFDPVVFSVYLTGDK